MKIDIHKGLENKEIRNFISNAIGDVPYDAEIITERSFRELKNEIKELQERLENAEKYIALKRIYEMNGWKEWDISDECGLCNDNGKYLRFYGTQSEYEALLDSLKGTTK